jgi:tetratricopeptide (TPR) repeat protein
MVRAFSRIADATKRQDWIVIISTIEELHSRGLDSDDTHYRLGCAYSMLENWNDAVIQFEAIKSELPEARENARRLFNYALALNMVGRPVESLGMLKSEVTDKWPPALRGRADQLVQHITERNVPRPGVQ